MQPIPNFEWYAARSKKTGQSPRCPIASSELCPRYYASTWHLAEAGVTTGIAEADVRRLDRKWEPFKPTVSEEEPGLTNARTARMSIHNFCPEVAYERFGAFVSFLGSPGDELDSQFRHEALSTAQAPSDDPRWKWGSYTERHFTECREFSIFSTSGPLKTPSRSSGKQSPRKPMGAKLRWQVLARDAFTCAYCGRRPPEVALEVDHRQSVATGGTDELENLCASCQDCNRGKGKDNAAVVNSVV
jgi:hypothetical protein